MSTQAALRFEDPAPPAPVAAADNDVESAYAIGRLVIEVDEPCKAASTNTYFVGHRQIHDHEEIRIVHVVSRTAGGEVRGYVIARGTLRLRGPAYAGVWSEMDALVARVTGAQLEPYVMRKDMPSMPGEVR